MRLCRKPEAFREAAVAPRVVPEGGGPLPALAEGARARGGDHSQAAHQARLVFLEAPVLLSPRLLKEPAFAGSFVPVLVVPPGITVPNPLCSCYKEVTLTTSLLEEGLSVLLRLNVVSFFRGARMCLMIIVGWFIFGKPINERHLH